MPKITISTNESVSVGEISATNTVVLLPIYIKAGEAVEVKYYGKNYSNNFDEDYNSRVQKNMFSQEIPNQKPDPSYTLAKLLINAGLNILVKPVIYGEGSSADDPSAESYVAFTENLATDLNNKIASGLYNDFKSVNNYNIAYITTGAHWNLKIEPQDKTSEYQELAVEGSYSFLTGIADNRGDCLAIIELYDYTPEELTHEFTVGEQDPYKTRLSKVPSTQSGALFYPWCEFSENRFPAGVGYLKAFANSLQTNPEWMAAAGVARGLIPDCTGVAHNVTEALAESLQSTPNGSSINPIMNINNYGFRIWGNRTGYNSATSYFTYLNVKVLLNILKKQIYNAAAAVTFEPNDDITWVNFKSLVNNLLDRMVSGRGIKSYSWIKNPTTAKATISATLVISPIEPVENFVINISITDSDETGTAATVEIV